MDKLKKTLGFAAGKSKDAWDMANKKSGAWMMEKQKAQLLHKLGEAFYLQYRKKEKNSDLLANLCLEIERTDREIDKALNRDSSNVSVGDGSAESPIFDPNVKRCKCGTPIVPGRLFCSLCGSKLVK
jgi:hypothetical protein